MRIPKDAARAHGRIARIEAVRAKQERRKQKREKRRQLMWKVLNKIGVWRVEDWEFHVGVDD